MDREQDPLDAGLAAAFGRTAPPQSVLNLIERKTGDAPRISLREEDSVAGGSPLIDPKSQEKFSLPQGRGAYQLMGEIARGGMGVVLKGHDTDLGRDVAVKVLNKELANRPEILQRFIEEAQIGGQLQHPGIVPVYELGLMADERPFFAMKLVKGRTLATLLAERESPAEDRRKLLDVFESVCQTMGYAHSRGVIHRDLKPANIMVGAFGEVQVVDWGLAKVLARGGTADEKKAREAHTVHTVLETVRSSGNMGGSGSGSDSLVGSVMGTPAYMPPEQAQGQVDKLDERSDVFALGAILCELLTGLPPYTGEKGRILAAAAQGETEEALARLDACQADPELVKLAKQCLVAAPAPRPRNGGVVAERLHRHLESVEERAQAARIEVAVQRRGRKLTVALAAAILGIFVAGGGGWLWVQNERITQQQEVLAGVGDALAEATLHQASSRWVEAHGAIDRAAALADTVAANTELLARVSARRGEIETAEESARAAKESATWRANLVERLGQIRSLAAGGRSTVDAAPAADDPDTSSPGEDADPATLKDRAYRELFAELGVDLEGPETGQNVRVLRESGVAADLALALDDWSGVSAERSATSRAPRRMMRLAMEVDDDPWRGRLRAALVEDDERVLEELVAESSDLDLPPQTAMVLGRALALRGREEQALATLERAAERHPDDFPLQLDLGRRLARSDESALDRALRHLTAAVSLRPGSPNALCELGYALYLRAELEEAERHLRAALETDPSFATPYIHLASVLHDLDNHDEERRVNRDALALYERELAKKPDDVDLMVRIASIKDDSSDPELLREARELHERAVALDPSAARHRQFGHFLGKIGEYDEALEHLDTALELAPDDALVHRDRGQLFRDRSDFAAAIESYENALALDPDDGWLLVELGRTQRRAGRPQEGLENVRRGLELDPDYRYGWGELGQQLEALGDLEGALAGYARRAELEPTHAWSHANEGSLSWRLGHLERGIAATKTAAELAPDDWDYQNDAAWYLATCPRPELRDAELALAFARRAAELDPSASHNTLGVALFRAGEWEECLMTLEQSMELNAGGEPRDWFFFGMAYAQLGDPDEARLWYDRAAEWMDRRRSTDEELLRFRAEAEQLLGLGEDPGGN